MDTFPNSAKDGRLGGIPMSSIGLSRIASFITASITAVLILVSPAGAQNVDCGNGAYCPRGNSCLLGGLCAPLIDRPPGSVSTSNGTWCRPGFRENKYKKGTCVPESYTECTSGLICPDGYTCNEAGTNCVGGPAATGPQCGSGRCAEGRICSSGGNCMNTQYFHDCGNGTVCVKGDACAQPNGCVLVSTQRTRQIRR